MTINFVIEQKFGRKAGSGVRVLETLKSRPIVSTSYVVDHTRLSLPTVIATLRKLSEIGICRELTGADRHLRFAYAKYLEIMSEDTEI